MDRPRYFSNVPAQARSRPADALPAIGVVADRAIPKSILGIAYPYTHVGEPDQPETVWRLVLDRAWVAGRVVVLADQRTLDGRYVLRHGEFIELAESAT